MSMPIFVVDAFSSKPFQGNPAAVCPLAGDREASWMQSVAVEMNLSETAFLGKHNDGYSLRWFTPATEVDLCGHATLASAHVLWSEGMLDPEEEARFDTRSGRLFARRRGDWIELDFPATPPEVCDAPPQLCNALGVEPINIARNQFDYLVEVESEHIVRNANPDFRLLATLPVRGVILTCRCTSGDFDFISRFFAPASGVYEDPVTGSAHCTLAPYWQMRLEKTQMTAFQASKRGGVVQVDVNGERVLLRGQAVTVWKGELLV